MPRVLVTGATGFIGGHLVRALLAQNKKVTGLARPGAETTFIRGLDVDLREGTLDDKESLDSALAGCDTVYHLAGLTKALSPEQLMRTNAQGTANVARACARQANPPTLVHFSSLAAAGPARRDKPRTESDPPKPVSNYGRSKLAGEESLRTVAKDVPISVLRPPMVFGEGDPGTFVMFQALKRSRVHVIPGLSRQLYSVIHAADLAELCLQIGERGERLTDEFAEGRGIYFAESARLSYAELGRCIGRALNHLITVPVPVPYAAVWAVGALADVAAKLSGKSRYMSTDKAREATAGSWICSAEKAVTQLGFEPPNNLPQQFQATAEWYRSEGWL